MRPSKACAFSFSFLTPGPQVTPVELAIYKNPESLQSACWALQYKALLDQHHPVTNEKTIDRKGKKQKRGDIQWYGEVKGLVIPWSTSLLWMEHPPLTPCPGHIYGKSWVNFTQTCVFIIQTRTKLLRKVWSVWTQWLDSQLRLTHRKDLRQRFMQSLIWSLTHLSHHFPEVLQEEFGLTAFQRRWRKKSRQLSI